MNYPSCIKMPISKGDNSPEKDIALSNGLSDKTSAITYDELISVADDVFGTGKWSHAVTSQTVDFVEYVMGKYHIGCAAFVRVELPDKTFHEEMGYSNAESSVKGLAAYSARASSITNALKKALLCFGGVIEKKMIEYTSNSNKRKLKQLNTTNSQTDKMEGCEIIKQSRTNTSTKRPQSPKASETKQMAHESLHDKPGANEFVVRKEVNEPKAKSSTTTSSTNSAQQQQQQQTNTATKCVDSVLAARMMTEEELRNKRKQKQKEKQEEYRRLMMKDKDTKVEEKVESKF